MGLHHFAGFPFTLLVVFSLRGAEFDYDTKTPYPLSRPVAEDSSLDLDGACGCRAVHVSGIARHGTRYPSLEQLDDLISLRDKLRNYSELKMIHPDYGWAGTWEFPSPSELPCEACRVKLLADRGLSEQSNLSQRISRRLPALFNGGYSSNSSFRFYRLISTDMQRTSKSAAAFAIGFNGSGNLSDYQLDAIPVNRTELLLDQEMRFFDLCDEYIRMHHVDNKWTANESRTFLDGPEMKELTRNISLKLTGNESENLFLPHDVVQMTRACIFESVFGTRGESPFCSLFAPEEWEVVSYIMDMEYYWKRSYGFDVNWKISCPLLRWIYHDLANYSQVKGSFRSVLG